MSEKPVKVLLELPLVVARSAKADAAHKGITLKKWWAEAAKAQLPELGRPVDEEAAQ